VAILNKYFKILKDKLYEVIKDSQNMAMVLLVISMTLYFVWRMFYLTPSFEELHDYCLFISKGPLYVMTSFSSEGNHIGYNLLSSIISIFCNNHYIELRGVAFIASIANIILLYRVAKIFFDSFIPFSMVVVYMGFDMVNIQTLQGRSYSLSTTLFLLTIYILCRITIDGKYEKKYYVMLTITFISAMYVLIWNIMWLVPIALSVTTYLIINGARTQNISGKGVKNKYYLQMINFFICEVIAVFVNAILYIPAVMGSGAGLVREDKNIDISRLYILIKYPKESFIEGINQIKNSFGAQQIEGSGYSEHWYNFVHTLCEEFVPGFGNFLILLGAISLIIMAIFCIRHFEESRTCIRLILIFTQCFVPFILIFTTKVPDYNVFLYIGVCIAFSFAIVMNGVSKRLQSFEEARYKLKRKKEIAIKQDSKKKSQKKKVQKGRNKIIPRRYRGALFNIPVVCAIVFYSVAILRSSFFKAYDVRTDLIYQALIMVDPSEYRNVAVSDYTQDLLLQFLYGIDSATSYEDIDYILLDKDMEEKSYDTAKEEGWYIGYYELPWEEIIDMKIKYENSDFIVYTK